MPTRLSSQRTAVAALAAIITLLPDATAQVTLEVTPYAGLYLPLGSMLRSNPPSQGFVTPYGSVSSVAQEKSVAVGAHMTAWLAHRLGIEGTFSYAPSPVTWPCRVTACNAGYVITKSAKVVVPLTFVNVLPDFHVGAGVALDDHGGDAYYGVASPTTVTPSIGVGIAVKLGTSRLLRIDAEDQWFRPHLTTGPGGCDRSNAVCNAWYGGYGGTPGIPGRVQHDVILSAGLPFRGGGRTPKEEAQRPGGDSSTPSPTQLLTARFGVAAGVTLPVGDYHAAGFGAGWQGMALVAFRIGRSRLGFRADGNYGTNTSHQPIFGVPTEDRVELLGADADLTVMDRSPGRVTPYVLAGPGAYRVSYTVTRAGSSYSGRLPSTRFAWNLGGGLTAGGLFFEARYVHTGGFGAGPPTWAFVSFTAGSRFVGW